MRRRAMTGISGTPTRPDDQQLGVAQSHNGVYTGSQDLDANGNWQNVPDYGPAWFPNEAPGWFHIARVTGCGSRIGDGPGFPMSRGAGLHITTDAGSNITVRGDGGQDRFMVRRSIVQFGRRRMCRSSDSAAVLVLASALGGSRSGRAISFTRGGADGADASDTPVGVDGIAADGVLCMVARASQTCGAPSMIRISAERQALQLTGLGRDARRFHR